jgi:multiple sugar transport system substrate-binding protein
MREKQGGRNMATGRGFDPSFQALTRRGLLGCTAGAGAGLALGSLGGLCGALAQESPLGIDAATWTPSYIESIAGTLEVDTPAECAKVVPLDYKGRLTYWWVGPSQAEPPIHHEMDAKFWEAFGKTYPNIKVEKQSLNYNEMLNKLRTAALGNAAPMVARLPILWGVEFAAKGQLSPLTPADVGHKASDFWPGRMKSVTWRGKTYGLPTNNETMALIWNAALFAEAGLDPEKPPATWADLVTYSKQIKDKTGKNGYGLVARANAGNTPFRFMPQCWAYGGGALDEARPTRPTRRSTSTTTGHEGGTPGLFDMYVRDRSVPVSALTNTQNENQDPFIAGQLAMMISHPTEYSVMVDRARRATGPDKKTAEAVGREHALRPDPEGPGPARGRVRRIERPHVQPGRGRRRHGHGRGARLHRLLDRPRMVDQDRLDRLQPGQPARLPDPVDEAAPGADPLPERHHRRCCPTASRSRSCPSRRRS